MWLCSLELHLSWDINRLFAQFHFCAKKLLILAKIGLFQHFIFIVWKYTFKLKVNWNLNIYLHVFSNVVTWTQLVQSLQCRKLAKKSVNSPKQRKVVNKTIQSFLPYFFTLFQVFLKYLWTWKKVLKENLTFGLFTVCSVTKMSILD